MRQQYTRECSYDVIVITIWRLEVAIGIATSVVSDSKSFDVSFSWLK